MIYSCFIILFKIMLLIIVPIVIYYVLLIMFFVVVLRVLIYLVVHSLSICDMLLLIHTLDMVLLCHSNQYVAHYVCRGAVSNYGFNCGLFSIYLARADSYTGWNVGTDLSFKLIYCSLCYSWWLLEQ